MPAGPLERAVELLNCLGGDPALPTVADLAGEAGVPTSTAYRLLGELERHGLVQREASGTVSLGTRVVALGRAAEARLGQRLVAPAEPTMRALARSEGETVILTAPCGQEAIVVHVVEAEHPVRLTYAAFRRAPMHVGASGKVLAAYLEPAERERLLAAVGDPALAGALQQIRARGWVGTSDELDVGASAAAAPVLDPRGRLLAGLSLAGPTERMGRRRLLRVADAVREAARTIELAVERLD